MTNMHLAIYFGIAITLAAGPSAVAAYFLHGRIAAHVASVKTFFHNLVAKAEEDEHKATAEAEKIRLETEAAIKTEFQAIHDRMTNYQIRFEGDMAKLTTQVENAATAFGQAVTNLKQHAESLRGHAQQMRDEAAANAPTARIVPTR